MGLEVRPLVLLRRRTARSVLVAGAVLAAVVTPLATGGGGAGATVIAGANNLSDTVSVRFQKPKERTTDIHLLGFNDQHGNLEAAGLNIYGKFAGGSAYLAKAILDRQARYGDHQATLMAGDNIGASPLANGLFHEEPVTIATNIMNVDFASVGNHEFDKGSAELLRIQNGGCHPVDGCTGKPYLLPSGGSTDVFPGADFQYLSSNVVVDATGETLFPAYGTKQFTSNSGKTFEVGFIGSVLESTPTIVTPTGVAGLTFEDEAEAANRAAAELADRRVKTMVLVIHEGGFQQAPVALNGCKGNLAGSPILDIVEQLDPRIKVIVSGHTHAEYRCTVTTRDGVTRLITSASSFGRVLTDITLTVDDMTGKLVAASAENAIVENARNTPGPGVIRDPDPSKADPTVAEIVQQYVNASAPLANQVIGRIQGDLARSDASLSALGESTLGDVIADAQLAATRSADRGAARIAFMNPGGIRADLRVNDISSGGEAPGEVTYGEAFTVQPFGNSLVTKTMTGAQIRLLLEQQFPGCGGQTTQRILQISATFRYEQARAATTCAGKIGRMFIDGVEVAPTDTFRVTMNNFLAFGGDGFTVFNQGTNPLGGDVDIDAFVAYFAANEPAGIAVPPLDRIVPVP
jgi:5'-nucleotidase